MQKLRHHAIKSEPVLLPTSSETRGGQTQPHEAIAASICDVEVFAARKLLRIGDDWSNDPSLTLRVRRRSEYELEMRA